jgi:hypothetical protein
VTPDSHYFVVRDRLWRMANPGLDEVTRDHLVGRVMAARAVRDARKAADREGEATRHRAVDEAKQARGERGPVWWTAGRRISTDTWRRTRIMPTGMRN